ncbi:hypothetical protein LCGC14_1289940 [marine sediment metagenome]|uniref:Uncharacterized protein n=1 Tax=marine sediment metagenome TaxID=412755 RepID=A0A0F9KUF8_9ZZZZ
MILLREVDKPKSLGEKISEYLARPPQPILKFYGDFRPELANGKKHLLFAVRNGLPVPLLYGIYVDARYYSFADYIEKTDHIGPFSTDDWRLTLDVTVPAVIEIRVGLIPFEFLLDRAQITV